MSQDTSKAGETIREVPFGTLRDESIGSRFPKNIVKTSKYTILTFLPLNTFEQLKKVGNFYFMVLSLVLYIGELEWLYAQSLKAYSTFLTLVIMMAVSAVMAALDDYRRHKSDVEMNSQLACLVLGPGNVKNITWSQVQVGDILLVKSEEEFPADLVPLFCSGDEGSCYVSTANLDGETNLKLKGAPACTQNALCGSGAAGLDGSADGAADASTASATAVKLSAEPPLLDRAVEKLMRLGGVVSAEPPQVSIHTFTGSLKLDTVEEALGAKQIFLRGTVLRNTAWAVGVVVYTGADTRVVRNSRKSPMKLSNLERVVNVSMLVFLFAQGAMALISDIFFNVTASEHESYWYLYPGDTKDDYILPDPIGWWVTFFGLYSNLIPISLYATVEICNAAQAFFIASDLEMFDRDLNFPAMARSTNLCQELGQVMYVFSDKTGTLTQNLMELKRVSISGEAYGHVCEEQGFQGAPAIRDALRKPARAEAINAFLEVLSVSHTVMVSTNQNGVKKFEAESPDEDALVSTAAELGWKFEGRNASMALVDVDTIDGKCRRQCYNILALNAFTSARKRMSVVAQKVPAPGSDDKAEYLLLVKGADNMMMERGVAADPHLEAHLTMFAQEGLRTLVIGRRRIPEAEFSSWIKEYESAQRALVDRDHALAAVAEKVETRLELLGATAIEDKLQVGVGDTIMRIRRAGVRLWVLTGDKLETARNIGYSTRVLSDEMEVLILDVNHGDKVAEVEQRLSSFDPVTQDTTADGSGTKTVGLMVTGLALEMITDGKLEARFLEIAQRCSVLIACRVSPLQKAQLVKLVRMGVKPTPVTLAVGDGANDVPMLQEAQVGVGICGREGRQAVNAADFAIGQFRFLQRLLLVHGRLNYIRACKFTLYTYWRSAAQVLLIFYYTFACGSGLSIFEDKTRMTFSVITSIPIIATGMFDRDMSDEIMLEHSSVYEVGRLGLDLNARKMSEEFASALVHSLLMYGVALLALPGMDVHEAGDYYCFGTAVYTCLIVVTTYRVAYLTAWWNWASVASIALAIFMYVLFLVIYGHWKSIEPPMYMVPYHTASNVPFWILVISVSLMAIVIDFSITYYQSQFVPRNDELIFEKVSSGQLLKMTEDPPPEQMPKIKPALKKQMSSFAFDHPLEVPRHQLIGSINPTAGDTSLGDVQPDTIGVQKPLEISEQMSPNLKSPKSPKGDTSKERFLEKSHTFTEIHAPSEHPFAQQKIPSVPFKISWWMVLTVTFTAGVILSILGVIALICSGSARQLRIQYDGDSSDGPMGTKSEEIHRHRCAIRSIGSTTSCTFDVTVAEDMEAPISVFYLVEPFFQNYGQYVITVVQAELEGGEPKESSRQKCKDTKSGKDASGQWMVPCGLMATSLFNDTFEILGMNGGSAVAIDETGIAWESEVKRFDNPSDYGKRPNTSWLYNRYNMPGIQQGQKDEHFIVWMRPEALATTQKPYGTLQKSLKAGDRLTLRINASFPVESLDARKELVLTTLTSFGGRDHGLGVFLIVAGILCLVDGAVVLGIGLLCPRRLGEHRDRGRLT